MTAFSNLVELATNAHIKLNILPPGLLPPMGRCQPYTQPTDSMPTQEHGVWLPNYAIRPLYSPLGVHTQPPQQAIWREVSLIFTPVNITGAGGRVLN